ncbi:MAG: hypothetical protein A2X35_10855 [Elusimicrobia bacterium GWA2_61_42]|nr:MAG: hypothetical protein A2X35_10855 [Elusimicrobia bacterium GWA2_61_42]OGR80448.1 MAG: hypothetical protein A2X38_03050 [Elusimicrobia bacterium GWC2_61_25]
MFFFAFSGYMAVSLLLTVILLLAALAGMKLSFALAKAAFGGLEVYRLKPLVCDAAGFALASSGTALAQYYLASLLVYTGVDRRTLAAAVFFAGVFCGLFFWRGALLSSLGSYGFSGLTVTLSAFIGGYSGLFQKPGENPWPLAVASLFN